MELDDDAIQDDEAVGLFRHPHPQVVTRRPNLAGAATIQSTRDRTDNAGHRRMTGRRLPTPAPQQPRICRTIRVRLRESGMSMQDLADRLHVSRSMIHRWTTTREPALDMIAAIERALGLPKGDLLREAGYVGNLVSVRQAVASDPKLDGRARRKLMAVYHELTG